MVDILLCSSIPNGKLLAFKKDEVDVKNIQEFLKALSITRDHRKNFLNGELFDDRWDCTSTKNKEIVVYAFVTQNKVFLQVIYFNNDLQDFVFNLISEYF